MGRWTLKECSGGIRLVAVRRRSLGAEDFTWADLLADRLDRVEVHVLFFPSRFDNDVDSRVEEALRVFGRRTGEATSVEFWDSTDPEFSRALALFDLEAPPAVVLTKGLRATPVKAASRATKATPYSITIADRPTLSDRTRLESAINRAHEVVVRGDSAKIARYLRARSAHSLLEALARLSADLAQEIVKCKPKFGLPGGLSIQFGS